MKKIAVVISLIFVTSLLNAQKIIRVSSDSVLYLKHNDKYKFILNNVNRFVYKNNSTEQKGEDFNLTSPEIFKAIMLPSFASFETRELSPDSINANTLTKNDSIANKIASCNCVSVREYLQYNRDYNAAAQSLNSEVLNFNRTDSMYSSYARVYKALNKLRLNAYDIPDTILQQKISLIRHSLRITVGENDTAEKISEKYSQLLKNSENSLLNIRNQSQILLSGIQILGDNIRTCIQISTDLLCGIKDTCSPKYRNLISEIRGKSTCLNQIKKNIDLLENTVAKAEEALKAMTRVSEENKIDEIQKLYNLIVRENFQLESETFVAEKDIHQITFIAKAEEPLPFGSKQARTVKVTGITYGGVKLDYSTGAFFNWGSNRFLGPDYYYEMPTDSTQIIREGLRSKSGMLSIGALAHGSIRTKGYIRPAVSAGVSITSGFEVMNFHGGLSFIFGKPGQPNRLILSYGLTLRDVNLLSNTYVLNVEGQNYPDEVPTSKNFPIVGQFIAITYNLKGPNK